MIFRSKNYATFAAACLLSVACALPAFAAAPSGLVSARTAFSSGRADEALRALGSAIGQNSANAEAWNLRCRVYLAQKRWNDAVSSCSRAVQLAPGSSMYHLWLGRAYGEKASRASIFNAYQTARLTHAEFETAVALDGSNPEALSDLGEYYVDAPGFLGGSYSQAAVLARRLDSINRERACELRAHLAESQKDYATAEQNWHTRIAVSQPSPEATAQAWMDLGSYYLRRGRWNEMLVALKNGAAADTQHGPALVDGASTLIKAGREPQLAAQWLREYLNGKALSADAPAFAVHAELGKLLRTQGDLPAANREFAAANALSANYATMLAGNNGE
ncbi:MAG TPA: tetratricopeptide repeat protein [Acidobacteriaceae bacterium]|nr:tetratricopeptide repeat protein [Acidobacteriaceae bacterium]